MAAHSRVAAVTGANKGIGLAIVRQLALQYPKSPLKSGPFLIYLTARSAERGAAAVEELQNDPQLKQAKVLAADGGDTTISYHPLDISQTKSVQDFRDYLKEEHPDGVDVVINNAGIAMQGFDGSVVKETLQTNYYGSLEATQDFLPLLRNGGRMVNVCSMAGKLNKYSDEIREAFLSASKKDVPAVTSVMQQFQQAVDDGREKEAGFPSAAYAVSKAGEIAFTKVIAMEESQRGRDVLLNACCPGYVKTDMTKGGGRKTVDEGAQTPVLLALHDIGGKTGDFWQHEEAIEW
ncbi:putative short-chain dehydrogenase/reductase SDR, NAD(P)-binding domain superfamily [Septoria linicola]|nr:putative short-chain dehydrogenase/reductase SDR, NAD(P)-binding domain superfamily [Septoria linicola]